jgi:cellulose synthase/poly-beta-1,6-N-acetylglucosamine synthase-like glycosyltransferase
MNSLASALTANSPRLSPPPTPLASTLIHSSVLLLWLLLFAASFKLGGVLAWGVGIAYIVYDTVLLLFVGWQSRRLLRPAAASASATEPGVTLGVIVAAHNEAAALPLTLGILLAQAQAPDCIVIADDGSSDGTAELLSSRYGLAAPALGQISEPGAQYPTLRWLRLPHGGKARGLNAAALHLHTEVVLTVDADTLLEPGAIAAFRQAFSAEPELVAATGVLSPVCGGGPGGRVLQWFQTYEYIRNFLSRHAWMQLDSLLLISGAFAGFRREALLAVGGFDPQCMVEDYELIHRLRRYAQAQGRSWRFRVLGSAQARTDAPATIPAFLRQRQRWFGGFLQTQYWYRSMVGNRQYGWLGTLMLPVKAVDTLQPLYGLTAFFLLLAYALGGRSGVFAPVATLIGIKIAIDLAYHLASVQWYRRWVHDRHHASFSGALLAAVAEPFTFQLLRHAGAAWGWWAFLAGSSHWGRQSRQGVLAAAEVDS